MKFEKCPYGDYEKDGVWKEKAIDIDKYCCSDKCRTCGWNPRVEMERKQMIKAGQWSYRAALEYKPNAVPGAPGIPYARLIRFIDSGKAFVYEG